MRLPWAALIPAAFLVVVVAAVAVAYAAGTISANAATVTISVIATAIAGLSLLLSGKANYTSEAALDETRRRNLLDRRPSLVIVTSRDKERRVPNYYLVEVQNSGPGVAHKVRVSLDWESLGRPVEDSIDSLPEQGTLKLPRETPCTQRDTGRICGTMTCKDGAGASYWWRRVAPHADWQSGTGPLPDDS